LKKFRIIPVVDLLNSRVVHAKRGDRKKYKPLKPIFLNSSNPIKIISKLNQSYNFQEIYVADLNAIMEKGSNIGIIKEFTKNSKIKILLDPGIRNKQDIHNHINLLIDKLILGLETLISLKTIEDGLKLMGSDKIIISIDMYNNKIISNIKKFKNQDPKVLMNTLRGLGVKNVILLDLFRVGQKVGGIPPIYLEIKENFKGNIFVGGGIRDMQDILRYKDHKFSGVLIGTALYDGTISKEQLEKNRSSV
jgi:phosphoribosylformimino-5-aminoimidazole carboxamide ribotide isomerase